MIEFFRLLYNPPPKHVNPIGLTCLKTPNAKNRENIPRPDRDPGAVCCTCKKLLHSIFQYKIFASSIGRVRSPRGSKGNFINFHSVLSIPLLVG